MQCQQATESCSSSISYRQETGELIGQPVKLDIFVPPADDFNDDRKKWDTENEGTKKQVHLGKEPDELSGIQPHHLSVFIGFQAVGRCGCSDGCKRY